MSFVDTFVQKFRRQLDVSFIVGTGLTCPRDGHPAGVPGCAEIVNEVIGDLPGAKSKLATKLRDLLSKGEIPAAYQMSIAELREQGNNELRQRIRTWCLRPYSGTQQAIRSIASDHSFWALRPGVVALGELLTHFPSAYSFVVTTNFDPMIEVAVHRAGGIPHSMIFDRGQSYAIGVGRIPVLHAHGFWAGETLHSDKEITSERPALRALMSSEFESIKSVQVVIGYGGWADNVMSTLSAGLAAGMAAHDLHWCLREQGDEAEKKEAIIIDKLCRHSGLNPQAVVPLVTFHRGVDADRDLPRLLEEVRKIRQSEGAFEVIQLRRRQNADAAQVADLQQKLSSAHDEITRLKAELLRLQGRLQQKDQDIANVVSKILQNVLESAERSRNHADNVTARFDSAVAEIRQTLDAEAARRAGRDLDNQAQWSTATTTILETLNAGSQRAADLDARHDGRITMIFESAIRGVLLNPEVSSTLASVRSGAEDNRQLLIEVRQDCNRISVTQARMDERQTIIGRRFRAFAHDHRKTWRNIKRIAYGITATAILVALILGLQGR